MRVFLAGLFAVFVITLFAVALIGALEGTAFGFLMPFLIVPIFFIGVYAAYCAFNTPSHRPLRWWKPFSFPSIEDLEKQGLVASREFRAKRAFQVGEYEDEGLHYFMELEDRGVLFLSGQYLYDYEPIEDEDDPELHQSRIFPCTEFSYRTHKTEGYVLELATRGQVLEPEEVIPTFSEGFLNDIPEDGEIIRGKSYDEIKREVKG